MIVSTKKKVFFIAVLIVACFAFIEGALHVVEAVRGGPPDPRSNFPNYKGKEWFAELNRDFAKFGSSGATVYRQYLGWGTNEFHTRYVNVDADPKGFSMRRTWNPAFPKNITPKKVFFMGGSTVWGAGARDEHTVPSLVSKRLNAAAPLYEVRNYGEAGYTFTQEMVKLSLLLRSGQIPDYVVFYDGDNDVVSAYDAGKAGALGAEDLIRQKLEQGPLSRTWFTAKELVRDYCKTCRIVINIGRSVSVGAFRMYPIEGAKLAGPEREKLAAGVADNYLSSLAFVSKLAEAYHFRYGVFWQPSLFTEDRFVGDEEKLKAIDWRLNDPQERLLYREVAERLKGNGKPGFYDVSDTLKDRQSQLYLDNVHISEEGNGMMAARIADIALKKIIPAHQ